MLKFRRINLFGGPGVSKSSTAAFIFSQLKKKSYSVELVTEYIKFWTYLNQKPVSFDQCFTFAQQLHQEDVILRSGVDYIISDSPLYLSCSYGYFNQVPGWQHLYSIAAEFESIYPSINFFLRREDKPYHPSGRFHTEEQARKSMKNLKILFEER